MHARLRTLLNRGLPQGAAIDLRIAWPLWTLPFLLIAHLLAPHGVWIVLLTVLGGIYFSGYWWVRTLAGKITLARRRQGAFLIAGDQMEEEFTLANPTRLPVIWAEFEDYSDVPDYDPGRIVSVDAMTRTRWRTVAECSRRGVFRLGPSRLILGDLFHFFRLTIDFPHVEQLLIYPRVLRLPEIDLPHGQTDGDARRRRPLMGAEPGVMVRDYLPGDNVRRIHWSATARHARFMLREDELEPSGDVWIVADMQAATHSGTGDSSTLEYAVILAVSLAAQLLAGSSPRAVGLLAMSGSESTPQAQDAATDPECLPEQALWIAPQAGQAQLWRVLAALAPARAASMPLHDLLRRSSPGLGRRRTLVVIAAQANEQTIAELVRLRRAGLESSVLLIGASDQPDVADADRRALARVGIPCQVLPVDAKPPPLITYRRTRTVIRSTPTGGAVSYEVEEEVG
ncbi:MAG: DUF58 domain-containing protein [Caldilineaceae bacterium]|nr:DUF58 domain-containing protein [Caldilineaceae bacterium]